MPSLPDRVSKGIMYVNGLSAALVHPFVSPDTSCYHSISWTAWAIAMKHTGNIH